MPELETTTGGAHSMRQGAWTETLAGLVFLISRMEEAERKRNTHQIAVLLRLTFLSSSHLVEHVFDSTTKKYIRQEKRNFGDSKKQRKRKREFSSATSRMSLKRVGLSRAVKKWPERLTGRKLPFAKDELKFLKRIADRSYSGSPDVKVLAVSPRPSFAAKQVVYTAVDACRAIEKHFFPDQEFTYSGWLKRHPLEKAGYF